MAGETTPVRCLRSRQWESNDVFIHTKARVPLGRPQEVEGRSLSKPGLITQNPITVGESHAK